MFRWTVVMAVLVSTVAAGNEVVAEEGSPALDKVVTVELGDVAATQIAQFFASGVAKQEFDAPVLVQYDRGTKKLLITIVGSRSNVEGARKSMADFLRVFGPFEQSILRKQRGIRLTDANTTIVYLVSTGYGESAQLKEVVRREDGKYITP
jgi:hypothetical protein